MDSKSGLTGKAILLLMVAAVVTACGNRNGNHPGVPGPQPTRRGDSALLIASDINYDVVVKPPTEGDPWQIERVSGYNGTEMIDDLFGKIYDGTLTARHITTGEPLNSDDIRRMEKELGSDRSLISKIQFTEDWFYHPSDGRIEKVVKEIILGYEFRDSQGNLFGYKALFTIRPGN